MLGAQFNIFPGPLRELNLVISLEAPPFESFLKLTFGWKYQKFNWTLLLQ